MVEQTQTADIGERTLADTTSIDVFELLSDPRRREVLAYLSEQVPPVALEELAITVATDETGNTEGEIPDERVTRIATSLYHSHIPKLVDADVVDYDRDADQIRAIEAQQIAHVLSTVEALDASDSP